MEGGVVRSYITFAPTAAGAALDNLVIHRSSGWGDVQVTVQGQGTAGIPALGTLGFAALLALALVGVGFFVVSARSGAHWVPKRSGGQWRGLADSQLRGDAQLLADLDEVGVGELVLVRLEHLHV